MYAALTVRRLKPGTYDDWRKAWEPDEWPESFSKAYILRKVDDPDEVIAFGFTDAHPDDLRAQSGAQEERDARFAQMAEFVESTGADGYYEVVDVVEPRG